nr:NBS-containing resistance-like protein [Tanacetum cinerariifolium]
IRLILLPTDAVNSKRSKSRLFLSQSKFSEEILEWAHMQHCNTCKTPVDTESNFSSDGDPVSDLLYIAALLMLFRLLTMDFSFMFHPLVNLLPLQMLIGLVALLPVDLLSAEYHGVTNVVAETAWIQNLFLELHALLTTATLVYCDNVSAVYLSTNPVQHHRTKHIEIYIYFVRDCVASVQGMKCGFGVWCAFRPSDLGFRKMVKISFELFKNSDQNFYFLPLLLFSSNINPTYPPPTTTSSQPPPPSHPLAATIQATGNPHPAADHHHLSRRLHHLSRHKR